MQEKVKVREAYGKYFEAMCKLSHAPALIDERNVYQEANPALSAYMDKMLDAVLLPSSSLCNIENFRTFYNLVTQEKKKGLILMEHYTNLDLPAIIYLLKKENKEWSIDFANKIVAVAGMKLNEASPFVRIWTEGFTRVVIYPTRSLSKKEKDARSEEERKQEEAKARRINFSAMRAMDTCHKNGQVILVFPSGTRYRPGDPSTKRGLREIDSYLRLFDVMLLVSINGLPLQINPSSPDDMLSDYITPDTVKLTAAPPLECKKFRQDILTSLPPDCPDPKQEVVDAIMKRLDILHNE